MVVTNLLALQESDGSGKETVPVPGSLGPQGSVASTRGYEVEECMCRVCGVFDDVVCSLPDPGRVQVL